MTFILKSLTKTVRKEQQRIAAAERKYKTNQGQQSFRFNVANKNFLKITFYKEQNKTIITPKSYYFKINLYQSRLFIQMDTIMFYDLNRFKKN